MEETYMQKIIENEQRSKSNTHRIDELEIEQKSQRELIISVKELATEVKHMREDVNAVKEEQKSDRESINSRLTNIEEKPIKRYEQIVSLIITRHINCGAWFFISKIRIVKR